MRNLMITVRESGATTIAGYPDGFPVDGDALHRGTLSDRARKLIGTDEDLLTAARTWLGAPLNPNDRPLTPVHVTRLIERLYTGGAARFITDRALVAA
jgi:hypothetical protein